VTQCDDCTTARVRTWGIYRADCHGCVARSIARSLTAFNALHPKGTRDVESLRDMVARLLPAVPTAEARRMVSEWWQHDRQERAAA
jgi:hypothetical protein